MITTNEQIKEKEFVLKLTSFNRCVERMKD